jgi:hypothetical protein
MKQNMKQNRDSKHASVNADVRKIYGETITRAQLFDYKKKTGIFAEWLQKGPEAHRVGRGLYAIPGFRARARRLPSRSPSASSLSRPTHPRRPR